MQNTDLLYKHYRKAKASCNTAILARAQEAADYYESFEWFVQLMRGKDPDTYIDALERTTGLTEALLTRIDKALAEYATAAIREKGRDVRRYDVLYSYYFAQQKTGINELAQKYHVGKSTIYEDIEVGKERMNMLLFPDIPAGAADPHQQEREAV